MILHGTLNFLSVIKRFTLILWSTRVLLTRIAFGCICLLVSGCSWIVPFYIVNTTAAVQRVEITYAKERTKPVIFSPQDLVLRGWKDGKPDNGKLQAVPQEWKDTVTVEIPPHMALELGRLMNENYVGSGSIFKNGRIFNLARIKCGAVEITRKTFDQYFQETSAGVVCLLP
jgi:hypothetical protein